MKEKSKNDIEVQRTEEFVNELKERVVNEEKCPTDFAVSICEFLSNERIYGLRAFSDGLMELDVSRYWFNDEQKRKFGQILVVKYPKFNVETTRMLALTYLRNTVVPEKIGEIFLGIWKVQTTLFEPVGEIVWELHHMLRRGEISGQMAGKIKNEIKELAQSKTAE